MTTEQDRPSQPETEAVDPAPPEPPAPPAGPIPYVRLGITGVFMGLANLVPGVSGGTMVLALGLYEDFIGAVSDVTRLRFSRRAFIVLAMLFGISFLTIIGLSGVLQYLMENRLPEMLGLFIGMTLGGAPLLHREIAPLKPGAWAGAAAGFGIMAAIALLLRPGIVDPNFALYFAGGIVGSSAMILPGISGSYMLLIMGLYVPIIAGISTFKDALKGFDIGLLFEVGLEVVLPVGLGLVVGIVALSNVLKFLLARHHAVTIGFLLGLLVGSVLGLYPFKPTSLDKLPRYAVEQEVGQKLLRVMTFNDDRTLERQLARLDRDRPDVRVLWGDLDREPTVEDIKLARRDGSVLLAYDVPVAKEVRRAAADKSAGEVELIIVPNTRYTTGRAVTVIVLVVVGFGVTNLLGRKGGGH